MRPIRPVILAAASILFVAAAITASAREAAKSLPATIRSISLEKTAKGYRWNVTHIPMPTLGEHQVLVHVHAISLNRDDLGLLAPNAHADLTGVKLGSDAAGDVVAVGTKVTGVRMGERVTNTYFRNWISGSPTRADIDALHGARVPGVAADYIALDDTAVVPMPRGYSYEEAATLPTAGVTAWVATVGRNRLGPSKVVVIEGTGGVSTFAMQFAAAAGARIILTSSLDEKLQRTLKIAKHESINYRSVPQWSQRVMVLTGGRGADLVVDVGGRRTMQEALRSLAVGGTLSVVGGLTGYDGVIPEGILLEKVARAQGVFVGSRADFRSMTAFIEAHKLHPVIERVFPIEKYRDALNMLSSDQFVGKIVLSFDEATVTPAK